MTPVAGDSEAGRAYLDLQRAARAAGRPTDELIALYVLEGFLARLSAGPARDMFVLKGGVLPAAFGDRRPTRDIDLAAADLDNQADAVRRAVGRIVVIDPPSPDGLVFDPSTMSAQPIREEDVYAGVRVGIDARLARARVRFGVDVNVGDPIWPEPTAVLVPRILGGAPIPLAGYPLHMVLAEKIVTAAQRGSANTRWRDYADVWTLSRRHRIDGTDLQTAIATVSRHRQADLIPLQRSLAGYPAMAQGRWAAWRRRSGLEHVPASFADVLEAVIGFSDPGLQGLVAGRYWNPQNQRWQ